MSVAKFPYPSGWLPYLWELVALGANPFRLWEYCWAFWEGCGPSLYLEVGDFGAGGFGYANFLRSHGQHVTVLDPILKTGIHDGFQVHGCKAHEYQGDPLSIVFCISAIEHMEDEDLHCFMTTLHNYLKPGGCAVFTCDLHLDKLSGQGEEHFGKNLDCNKVIEMSNLPAREFYEPISGFPHFSPSALYSNPNVVVSEGYCSPLTAQGFILEKPVADLYGILCVMNEDDVLAQWLCEHTNYFKHIVAIDNSTDNSRAILEATPGVTVLKQEELIEGAGYDNIRQFAFEELRRIGMKNGDWVQLCHADEFLIHDPRTLVTWAILYGSDTIWWNSPFFVPTQEEGVNCFDETLSVHDRFQYWVYHLWDKNKQNFFEEFRTFRVYQDTTFSNQFGTVPCPNDRYERRCHRLPFLPAFKHFGWRSIKHANQKFHMGSVNEAHRPKEWRWGSRPWQFNNCGDLYRLIRADQPKKYCFEDFKLPKWYSVPCLH